jgi:hypothetical protein
MKREEYKKKIEFFDDDEIYKKNNFTIVTIFSFHYYIIA